MTIMHWQPIHHNALSYVNRSSALSNQETAAPGRFPACRPSDDSPTKLNRLGPWGHGLLIARLRRFPNLTRQGPKLDCRWRANPFGDRNFTHSKRSALLDAPASELRGSAPGASGVTPMRCPLAIDGLDGSRSIFAVKTPMAQFRGTPWSQIEIATNCNLRRSAIKHHLWHQDRLSPIPEGRRPSQTPR